MKIVTTTTQGTITTQKPFVSGVSIEAAVKEAGLTLTFSHAGEKWFIILTQADVEKVVLALKNSG